MKKPGRNVRFADEPLKGKTLEAFILKEFCGGQRLESLPYKKAVMDEYMFCQVGGKELYDLMVWDDARVFDKIINDACTKGKANRSEAKAICDRMRAYINKRYKDEINKISVVKFSGGEPEYQALLRELNEQKRLLERIKRMSRGINNPQLVANIRTVEKSIENIEKLLEELKNED